MRSPVPDTVTGAGGAVGVTGVNEAGGGVGGSTTSLGCCASVMANPTAAASTAAAPTARAGARLELC